MRYFIIVGNKECPFCVKATQYISNSDNATYVYVGISEEGFGREQFLDWFSNSKQVNWDFDMNPFITVPQIFEVSEKHFQEFAEENQSAQFFVDRESELSYIGGYQELSGEAL